jgi:hypothetical protein
LYLRTINLVKHYDLYKILYKTIAEIYLGGAEDMGYLESSKPIIGYVLLIALIMTMSTLVIMGTVVSQALASSATLLASMLVLVSLLAAVSVFEAYGRKKSKSD